MVIKQKLLWVALGVLIFAMSPIAHNWAGTLDPEIRSQLEQTSSNDFVRAVVVMSKQANLRQVAGTYAKITTLQRLSNQTQRGLIDMLSKGVQDGTVKSYHRFWIFNGVQTVATSELLNQIATLPEVRIILPDHFYSVPQLSYDKGKSEQTNCAKQVWDTFQVTGKGVTIGVLGTGADLSVANLRNTYRGGGNSWFDACETKAQPYDDTGFGTTLLNVLTDSTGGIAPEATWMAAKVMDRDGGYASWLYAGLQWVADADGNPRTHDIPRVINVPLSKADFARDIAAAKAVDNLCQLGIFCVITVGLDVNIPLHLNDIPVPVNPFAVGALDERDEISLFGKQRTMLFHPGIVPELSASAARQPVPSINGGFRVGSGEFLACAQVMGAVALLGQADPHLSVADLRWILKRTASDLGRAGIDSTYGAGKLNLYAAVSHILGTPDIAEPPDWQERTTPLLISPQEIVIDVTAGKTGTRTVTISNPGQHSESIHIRAETVKSWLDFEPPSLELRPGGMGIVTLTYDARILTPGNYTAELFVASELEETALSVKLTVSAEVQEKRELKGLGATVTAKPEFNENLNQLGLPGEGTSGSDGSSNSNNDDDTLDDHSNSRRSGTQMSYGGEEFGEIGTRRDRDYFVFEGKKGDTVTIDITAETVGSELDSVLELYQPNGRRIAYNDDDGMSFDSFLNVELPEDGQYAIRVRAYRYRGGPGEFYILNLSK